MSMVSAIDRPHQTDSPNRWLHLVHTRDGALWALIVLSLLVLYIPVGLASKITHIDPYTNTVTAWSLATEQTPIAGSFRGLERPVDVAVDGLPWFRETPNGPVSQYPPGAALTGTPLAWLAEILGAEVTEHVIIRSDNQLRVEILDPPRWPGILTGAVTAAAAVAFGALNIRRHHSLRFTLGAAAVIGFGTTLWTVAGTDLWQHGPAAMWLMAALFALRQGRAELSGLAMAMAVLTRPHTAVIAAALGLAESWRTRTWRPVLGLGIGSVAGLATLVAFNSRYFGRASISGGYSDGFGQKLTSIAPEHLAWFAGNIVNGLLSPAHGLFVYSPFLLVVLLGLRDGWRKSSVTERAAAIGGLAYLLIQWKSNRASGGTLFWGYRYPIEALVMWIPLGAHAARAVLERAEYRRILFGSAAISVALHAVGAITLATNSVS